MPKCQLTVIYCTATNVGRWQPNRLVHPRDLCDCSLRQVWHLLEIQRKLRMRGQTSLNITICTLWQKLCLQLFGNVNLQTYTLTLTHEKNMFGLWVKTGSCDPGRTPGHEQRMTK